MHCGFQWEDEEPQDDGSQCEGHHECVDVEDHEGDEHECACGETTYHEPPEE